MTLVDITIWNLDHYNLVVFKGRDLLQDWGATDRCCQVDNDTADVEAHSFDVTEPPDATPGTSPRSDNLSVDDMSGIVSWPSDRTPLQGPLGSYCSSSRSSKASPSTCHSQWQDQTLSNQNASEDCTLVIDVPLGSNMRSRKRKYR